jgi:predicted nucleic acid-binding protein
MTKSLLDTDILSEYLIAAVAVRLQMPLVTGNTEDFQAIQGTGANLVLENWREAA